MVTKAALTLIAATVLVTVHLVAGRLRFLDVIPGSRRLSLAGGVSVTYFFVRLLPELDAGTQITGDSSFCAIPGSINTIYI